MSGGRVQGKWGAGRSTRIEVVVTGGRRGEEMSKTINAMNKIIKHMDHCVYKILNLLSRQPPNHRLCGKINTKILNGMVEVAHLPF